MPPVTDPIPADQWGLRVAVAQVRHPPLLRRAREDHGLFGPGSPAWEVWGYPTVLLAAFRAAIVQMFQPQTAAGVSQNSVYQRDPLGRLRRTGDYFLTVVFGDGCSVVEAAEMLRRVHDRVTGVEPLSGTRYAANDPENQLWVHLTAWHSALYLYERLGPGELEPGRESRYWHECQLASELQGLDPANVPGTRHAVREYFASMRPRLCVSEPARETIDWLLAPSLRSSKAAKVLEPAFLILARIVAPTLPAYLREMAGIERSEILAAVAPWVVGVGARAANLRGPDRWLAAASPEGYAVRHAALHGPPPSSPKTIAIAEARAALQSHRRLPTAA